jgi:hypothetical protein
MIDTTTIEMLSGLAERLHKAGVFGAEVTSADKAFAVLLKGHELGFTPMAAAGSISIIKGKVSLSAAQETTMNDRMIAEVVQRTLVGAGELLSLEVCRAETRMHIALGVEGAMDALYYLAVGESLSLALEGIRRGAASAARLYGRQYAEEMVQS